MTVATRIRNTTITSGQVYTYLITAADGAAAEGTVTLTAMIYSCAESAPMTACGAALKTPGAKRDGDLVIVPVPDQLGGSHARHSSLKLRLFPVEERKAAIPALAPAETGDGARFGSDPAYVQVNALQCDPAVLQGFLPFGHAPSLSAAAEDVDQVVAVAVDRVGVAENVDRILAAAVRDIVVAEQIERDVRGAARDRFVGAERAQRVVAAAVVGDREGAADEVKFETAGAEDRQALITGRGGRRRTAADKNFEIEIAGDRRRQRPASRFHDIDRETWRRHLELRPGDCRHYYSSRRHSWLRVAAARKLASTFDTFDRGFIYIYPKSVSVRKLVNVSFNMVNETNKPEIEWIMKT
jgi:hypothetical protein